jgi:hypothetical protein
VKARTDTQTAQRNALCVYAWVFDLPPMPHVAAAPLSFGAFLIFLNCREWGGGWLGCWALRALWRRSSWAKFHDRRSWQLLRRGVAWGSTAEHPAHVLFLRDIVRLLRQSLGSGEGVVPVRTAAPALFPLLRSALQAKLLVRILLGGAEESVVDLAAAVAADPGNTAREVARLERAGIVATRRVGRTKLVQANTRAPFYRPLLDLVTIVLGPAKVLAEEIAGIDGVVCADVFGSWAARYHGEPGPLPADVDLLVVGKPDRDDLHDATQAAARRLNRPVNPVIVSPRRWNTSDDGFIRELHSRPRVRVLPADDQEAR